MSSIVALGVGATASLGAVLYILSLSALPYPGADRLFVLSDRHLERSSDGLLPPGRFRDFSEGLTGRADLAAVRPGQAFNAVLESGAVRLQGMLVTPNLLAVLQRRVSLGRDFTPGDAVSGAAPVVLVSSAAWRLHFGGRADVTGRTLVLNGVPHEIVGVLPHDLPLPVETADVWVPLEFTVWNRVSRSLVVMGRTTQGTDVTDVARDVETHQALLGRRHPDTDVGWVPTVADLRAVIGAPSRRPLELVVAGSLLLNGVVALNLGILLVARVTARRHEFAVRRALGASRLRIAAIGLGDAMALVLPGCAAGAGLAWLATPLVLSFVSQAGGPAPLVAPAAMTWPLVAFASATACGVAGLAMAIPALMAARIAPFETLRQRQAATSRPVRRLLVVGEVAVAIVLVTLAAFVGNRLAELESVDLGFRPATVLTASVALPARTHGSSMERRRVVRDLLAAVRGLPGVESVAAGSTQPFGGPLVPFNVWFEDGTRHQVQHRSVTEDYFATLGIRLEAGRVFTTADREDGEPVAILGETVARAMAGEAWRTVPGRRISVDGPDGPWRTVTGVVADTRHAGPLGAVQGELYLPWPQDPWPGIALAVRPAPGFTMTRAPLAAALRSVDAGLPLYDVRPLVDRVDAFFALHALISRGLAVFGVLAAAIAVFGVWALVAWTIEARRLELGVRLALGALPRRVAVLIVREVALLLVGGVAIGLPAAWLTGALASSLAPTFAALSAAAAAPGIAALGSAVLLAALPLARRAGRVSPAEVLRGN